MLSIDADLCTGCEACIERCLLQALSIENERVVMDDERCIGCGACVYTCPTEALRLVRKPQAEIKAVPQDFDRLFSEMGWR